MEGSNIKLYKLLASFILCFLAAALGSVFTTSQIPTWYATLHKPPFNPPNWIFGPVWTLLYALMAVSLYLVWTQKIPKSRISEKKESIQYFILQLIFNVLWSVVFFSLHAPLAAFMVIIALWVFIYGTIHTFSKINPLAGQLLYPYLLWVSFASILNLSVVLLN